MKMANVVVLTASENAVAVLEKMIGVVVYPLLLSYKYQTSPWRWKKQSASWINSYLIINRQ